MIQSAFVGGRGSLKKNAFIQISKILRSDHSTKRNHVQDLLGSFGLEKIVCRRVSAIYRLQGDLSPDTVQKIAGELLCDNVIEKFSIDESPGDPETFFADVWYKPGVTDTTGDSVLKAIRDLNVTVVEDAASGTRYEFCMTRNENRGDGSPEERISDFVNRELLNPLIQICQITKPSF